MTLDPRWAVGDSGNVLTKKVGNAGGNPVQIVADMKEASRGVEAKAASFKRIWIENMKRAGYKVENLKGGSTTLKSGHIKLKFTARGNGYAINLGDGADRLVFTINPDMKQMYLLGVGDYHHANVDYNDIYNVFDDSTDYGNAAAYLNIDNEHHGYGQYYGNKYGHLSHVNNYAHGYQNGYSQLTAGLVVFAGLDLLLAMVLICLAFCCVGG
eukprot:395136_1